MSKDCSGKLFLRELSRQWDAAISVHLRAGVRSLPRRKSGEVSRNRTTSQFCTSRLPERRSPQDSGRGHLPGRSRGSARWSRPSAVRKAQTPPQPAPPGPTPRGTTRVSGPNQPVSGALATAAGEASGAAPNFSGGCRQPCGAGALAWGLLDGSSSRLATRTPDSGRCREALRGPASGLLTGRPNTSQEAEQRAGRPGAGMWRRRADAGAERGDRRARGRGQGGARLRRFGRRRCRRLREEGREAQGDRSVLTLGSEARRQRTTRKVMWSKACYRPTHTARKGTHLAC